jgi:hypothetical protein
MSMNVQERKGWVEIILMPLAVALVGVTGTYLVTAQQAESARRASEAQIAAAREASRAERQIKVLDIFGEKITSKVPSERILALNILRSVEPDLGGKLAKAVGEAEQDPNVRAAAQTVFRALTPAKVYLHIWSNADRRDAAAIAERLEASGITVPDVRADSDSKQESQLRYFRRSELPEASQIVELLRRMGIRSTLRYVGGYEQELSERPRQYGLWLSANPLPG